MNRTSNTNECPITFAFNQGVAMHLFRIATAVIAIYAVTMSGLGIKAIIASFSTELCWLTVGHLIMFALMSVIFILSFFKPKPKPKPGELSPETRAFFGRVIELINSKQ